MSFSFLIKLEPSVALGAWIFQFIAMSFVMQIQVPFICYSLVTSGKLTGPCFGVSFCMCCQVTLPDEFSATVFTLVFGLSHMHIYMLGYFTPKMKRLITKFTSILLGKMSGSMPY